MTYPFSFGFVVTDGGSRPITGVDLDKTVGALMEAMLGFRDGRHLRLIRWCRAQ